MSHNCNERAAIAVTTNYLPSICRGEMFDVLPPPPPPPPYPHHVEVPVEGQVGEEGGRKTQTVCLILPSGEFSLSNGTG